MEKMLDEENNLKEMVLEKVNKEAEEYNNYLLSLSKKGILDRAYEKVCKDEIIELLSYNTYSDKQYETLLNCESILGTGYIEWLKTDSNFYENMEIAIDKLIRSLEKTKKEQIK